MPPRKRRRTAWTALSETSGLSYAPHHTTMTLGTDGIYRITLSDMRTPTQKPPPTLPDTEEIADFAPLTAPPTPTPAPASASDPIADSPQAADSPPPRRRVPPTHRSANAPAPPPPPPPVDTPSSIAPTPPTALVARSLFPAMDQAGPSSQLPPTAQRTTPVPATPDLPAFPTQTPPISPAAQHPTHHTPLMVTASAIRRAQIGLGITPDTSSRTGLLFVDPDVEAELRAVQSSTRKMNLSSQEHSLGGLSLRSTPLKPVDGPPSGSGAQPASAGRKADAGGVLRAGLPGTTPVRARRRLSGISTVTPIPLNLESPPASRGSAPVENEVPVKQLDETLPRNAAPFITNGKGIPLPLPVTSAQSNLASPITPAAKERVQERNLAPGSSSGTNAAARSIPKPGGAMPSLFMTGKGVPVQIPPGNGGVELPATNGDSFKTPLNATAAVPPLFTTGSGKKVNIPSARPSAGSLTKGFDLAPPLFTTGSGKKVTIPPPNSGAGSGTKGLDLASLFSTGKGKPVTIPDQGKLANLLSRPPPSPRTPSSGPSGLRKSLFRAQAPRGEKMEPGKSGNRVFNTGPTISRRGLKSTPFKRPRQVPRPQNSAEKAVSNKKKASSPVPSIEIPELFNNGRACCKRAHHQCTSRPQASFSVQVPDYLLGVDCLRRCLEHVFRKDCLGDVDCLPPELTKHVALGKLSEFGVQNCVEWMKTFFTGMSEKPASCVGSAAWVKMSYSLAVWKLGKLDLAYNETNGTEGCRFLCASNVIREVLRRISYEWHNNRQPHLLRIMRRDSAPSSHVVLLVAGIEEKGDQKLSLTLTDGWYVARAIVDGVLERRIRRGKIRIGEKFHIAGAQLQPLSSTSTGFFFGSADELGSAVLRICANNVRKRLNAPNERLGIHRFPLITNSLRWITDDGGQCPTVKVVILRSYPIFFMESVPTNEEEDEDKQEFIFRREDAEFEARAAHEENIRQKCIAAAESRGKRALEEDGDFPEIVQRDVRCGKEILICGITDDPSDSRARKVVRVYNPTEGMQTCLTREGQILLMAQMWPKKNAWTCRSQGIRSPQKGLSRDAPGLLLGFPRNTCSIVDLQNNAIVPGNDFDGIFCVLYVSSNNKNSVQRFVYFADDIGDEIRILAVEMSGFDVHCLPRALRFKPGHGEGTKFPIIALRDVEFQAVSEKHELVHARATLRSSFISSKAVCRQHGKTDPLKETFARVESHVRGKDTQLQILREAVMSFALGTRGSIGAYFTSTQDM